MITAEQDLAAWALLITELDEAREHLATLVDVMAKDGKIAPEDYAVQLGHIFAHLNRAWHSRNQVDEISDSQWHAYSAFPKDLQIHG